MIKVFIIFIVIFCIVIFIFIKTRHPQQLQQPQLPQPLTQLQLSQPLTQLQLSQPLTQLPTQQPQLPTQQPQLPSKTIDCAGVWENVGECTINRCDQQKNTIGLGKQKQKFVASTKSQNQGKPCPTTKEVDCSLNNYIGCTQCGGSNGKRVTGASCDNIKKCDGLIGIGERIDKWSVSSNNALPYCVIPKDSKVTCYESWPNCDCSYDISSNTYCNESNTVCEGNTSTCTVNFTKTKELPGGICKKPEPKHYNVNLDKCNCTVTRKEENWVYTNPRCDPSNRTTFIADNRTRLITITKTGGNKSCTFPKLSNETILDTTANKVKGKINPNGNLQFGSTNDFTGATFQTVQTENSISFPDNPKCKCEGTYGNWKDWENWTDNSACPNPTDYSNPRAFYITQNRIRKRPFNISNANNLYANYSCPQAEESNTTQKETRDFTCRRHCSGTWSNWTDCIAGCPGNASAANRGISTLTSSGQQPTHSRTFRISENKSALGLGNVCTDIDEQVLRDGYVQTDNCDAEAKCPINCQGTWDANWSACKIGDSNSNAITCAASNVETSGTKYGNKYKHLNNPIGPFNGGDECETEPKSQSCSVSCDVDCKFDWDANWSGCTAPACGPSDTETETSKKGTEYKNFIKRSDKINNGADCPKEPKTQECIKPCVINCKGGYGKCDICTGFSGRGCGGFNKKYTRTDEGTHGTGCPATGSTTSCTYVAGVGYT
jgi:hypothetical protein